MDTIFQNAVASNIEIVFDLPNNIKLHGLKDDVNKLRDEINHMLHGKLSGTPSGGGNCLFF